MHDAPAEEGVPKYFGRRSVELRAVLGAPPAEWQSWMAQAGLAGDEAARGRFAREVVAAKPYDFAALAVRFKLARAEETADELKHPVCGQVRVYRVCNDCRQASFGMGQIKAVDTDFCYIV